jgi:hypothetical protein
MSEGPYFIALPGFLPKSSAVCGFMGEALQIGFRCQHFEDGRVKKHPPWSSSLLTRMTVNQGILIPVSISEPSGDNS